MPFLGLGQMTARGAGTGLGTRWQLRIRLSGRHPRVGTDDSGSLAGKPAGETRRGRIVQRLCSLDGTVLGLGPFVDSPCGEGTVELPASNSRHLGAGKPALGWRWLR